MVAKTTSVHDAKQNFCHKSGCVVVTREPGDIYVSTLF